MRMGSLYEIVPERSGKVKMEEGLLAGLLCFAGGRCLAKEIRLLGKLCVSLEEGTSFADLLNDTVRISCGRSCEVSELEIGEHRGHLPGLRCVCASW